MDATRSTALNILAMLTLTPCRRTALLGACISLTCLPGVGRAADVTWKNTATDFNADTSWTGDVAPTGATDVATFGGTPASQPQLTAPTSVRGLKFTSKNWQVSGAHVLSVGVSGVVVTNNPQGTVTLDAAVLVAGDQPWWMDPNCTLVVNGALSGSGNITKPKTSQWGSASPIRLTADNSGYSGAIIVQNGSIEIGHDSGTGSGRLVSAGTYGAQAPSLVAYGASRMVATPWQNGFAANSTYDLTIAGDTAGAQDAYASIGWKNNGTGKLTLAGTLQISIKECLLSGTGPIQIAGSQSNLQMDQNNNDGMKVSATLVELNKLSGKNVSGGHFTVLVGGTARWLADNQLADTKRLNMRGGTVDLNNHAETTGAMVLSENSTLVMGSATSALSLAASTTMTWTAGKTLLIKQFVDGSDTLRFGASDAGLTSAQLAQIQFEGWRNAPAWIDAQGYVHPPKPLGTVVLVR